MAEAAAADAVRSLFIPIEQGNLLMPGTLVAEIVGFKPPVPLPDGGPDWLLGELAWREQRVPVIALEPLIDGSLPQVSQRARIVVLKALTGRPGMPYVALVARDIPRLLVVQEGTVEPLGEGDAVPTGVACEVLANGEPAIIPDVTAIEDLLYAALNP
jgi:chemosensory pili system protein ChpC